MGKKLTQRQAYKAGTDDQFVEPVTLGPWTSYSLLHDPIHMSFVLSRYKFVARMFAGKDSVLEVGCGDAFGTPIMAQFVKRVLAIDIEGRHIQFNRQRLVKIPNIEFKKMDICQEFPDEKFEAVFSIDVIEHLDKHLTRPFMENQCKSLIKDGLCIIGTPNITANEYATERSRVQHINLQSGSSLRKLLFRYFKNVFMFSMNDEVVHTGFLPMAHYLFGMGVSVR